jgi:hypothetical protein
MASMSVGLAWRIVFAGIASEEEVEGALRAQLTGGMPFLRAMLLRSPEVLRVFERELGAAPGELTIDRELTARLPEGASSTFLSVPIGRDPETGIVLVATADPLDRHVAQEIAFHLGEPVRLVPASLDRLLAALPMRAKGAPAAAKVRTAGPPIPPSPRADRIQPVPTVVAGPAPARRGGTPAYGTPALDARPSEPPIPLVRVSSPAAPSPVAPVLVPASPSTLDDDEPVIALTRSLLPTPALAPEPGTAERAPRSLAMERIQAADTADGVLEAVVEGMSVVAASVIAFGVRGNLFVGREALGVDRERARHLGIPADRPSILKTAAEIGHYLGPVPVTEPHQELAKLIDHHPGEVAAHAVNVGGRAATIVLMAGMENAYAATSRAEQLVRAAGKALETLVRARKR